MLSKNAQEKLRKFLDLEFCSVYCDTCRNRNMSEEDPDYRCDECHRKSTYWEISDGTINTVLAKLSEVLEEENV